MDPIRFLRTKDPFERQVMWTIARAAQEIRRIEQQNLAVLIQHGISKLLGG